MTHDREVYSKSIEKDGKRKSLRIEEADNGYIVSITTTDHKEDGEVEMDEKKFISKDNPLDKKEMEEGQKDLDGIVKYINSDYVSVG